MPAVRVIRTGPPGRHAAEPVSAWTLPEPPPSISPQEALSEALAVFLADRRELPAFRAVLAMQGWCGLHLPAGWPMS